KYLSHMCQFVFSVICVNFSLIPYVSISGGCLNPLHMRQFQKTDGARLNVTKTLLQKSTCLKKIGRN
ncbi:MAG TPA: hypothetical protein PLI57_11260, partial [Spirochaetota bacterium]|nr:hypothetical protein [Spirochaetota bacterium]